MRPIWWVLTVAAVAACATTSSHHERRGDHALGQGDKRAALTAYEAALAEKPIMDFDYERLREKVKRVRAAEDARLQAEAVAQRAARALTAVPKRGSLSKLEYARTLLEARRRLRDQGEPRIHVQNVEAELLSAIRSIDDATLGELVGLWSAALSLRADRTSLDAISVAMERAIPRHFKPLQTSEDALQRLPEILTERRRLIAAKVPDGVYAAMAAWTSAFGTASFTKATADTARDRLERIAELRTQALAVGGPPEVLKLLDAAQDDATQHLLASVEQKRAAKKFVAAYDELAQLAHGTQAGSPLRKRLAEVSAEAAVWFTAEADRLPHGYRRLFVRALATTFGAKPEAHYRDGEKLLGEWQTALSFRPTVRASPDCGSSPDHVSAAFGTTNANATAVRVQLQCAHSTRTGAEKKIVPYETEEQYIVRYQWVWRTTFVDGTQTSQQQCTRTNYDLKEQYVGVCSEQSDVKKEIQHQVKEPVYGMRPVKKNLEVTVRRKTVKSGLSATATATWDDGTVYTASARAERSGEDEEYDYRVPPKKVEGSSANQGTHEVRKFDPALSTKIGAEAANVLVADLKTRLTNEIHKGRTRAVRADAEAARARRDQTALTEKLLRLSLMEGTLDPEIARDFEQAYGVKGNELVTIAKPVGVTRTATVTSAALPAVTSYYAPTPLTGDNYQPRATPGPVETTDTDTDTAARKNVRRGTEAGSGGIGFAYHELQAATGKSNAATVQLDMSFGALGWIGTPYGIRIHDELGGRASIGMRTGDHAYANGKDEKKLSWAVGAHYRVFGGVRTHRYGAFAGAGVGWQRITAGETKASGAHLGPALHLTARAMGVRNITLDASGFVSIGGMPRQDRLMFSVPIKHDTELCLLYERTELSTSTLAEDGVMRTDLGRQPVTAYGVLFGGRY